MKHIDQQISVTNENIKKGKVAYVVGNAIFIMGSLIPFAKCTLDTASDYSNSPVKGLVNLEEGFPSNMLLPGIIMGIGAVLNIYGRIKHWYYNRPL